MSPIGAQLRTIMASAGVSTSYTISQSCRFNDDDSAYLTRTPGSSGDRKTFTLSFWMKLGNILSNSPNILNAYSDASNGTTIRFGNSGFQFYNTVSGTSYGVDIPNKFRDPSSWYHIVFAVDTTQATATNRARVYLNGTEQTTSVLINQIPQNQDTFVNHTVSHAIGRENDATPSQYFDGYLADVYLIDGTQYAASDFGETDDNGNWIPKNASGLTFGTNGAHFLFEDSANLGNDSNGGTDWTENDLAANDQVTDSPTDDADSDVGNYCTVSPLTLQANMTLANGNLFLDSSSGDNGALGTIGFDSGKFYWETSIHSGGAGTGVYFVDRGMDFSGKDLKLSADMGNAIGTVRRAMCALTSTTNLARYYYNSDGATGTISTIDTSNDRICCAVDADANTCYIGHYDATDGVTDWLDISGNLVGNPSTGTSPTFNAGSAGFVTTGLLVPLFHTDTTGLTVYFDHNDCIGDIPTDFKPLHTANLPAPTIKDPSKYFQVDTFTGTGAELVRTLTDAAGDAVQPDLVWIKDRDGAVEHVITDSARGATKELNSDANSAESTVAQGLKSFDASGYTLGTDGNYNTSSSSNVAWCWVAGSGAGSSNEDGSINTTATSVNDTAGFSISTYTGTGSAATVGHGLSVAPDMVIIKRRDSTNNWIVYHSSNTSAPETDHLVLDTNAATLDDADKFNDTAPTASVFSVGTGTAINGSSATYVAYCFRAIPGYSAFGSYTGNGNASDGPFIYTGFRPAWVMVKCSSATGNWEIIDVTRSTYNSDYDVLYPDTTGAEYSSSGIIDINSNGFKWRSSGTNFNGSGTTHIYAAFAEHPFGGDGVSQARAR